ncbi:MAG: TonB-dependent receptor [Saprospiraceae bacterium]|nr:TonB-dependent receptor [Saprospiraceae bacterium]
MTAFKKNVDLVMVKAVARILILSTLLLAMSGTLSAQRATSLSDQQISIEQNAGTLSDAVASLNRLISGTIYYEPTLADIPVPAIRAVDAPLGEVLEDLLRASELGVLYHRGSVAVLMPASDLTTTYTDQYYQALEESIIAGQKQDASERLVGNVDSISQSGRTVVRGTVTDLETGEEVVGATLLIEGTNNGTATEADGSYVLELVAGSYMLAVQYVGYQQQRIPLKVISSGRLDVALTKSAVLLDEVVVQAKSRDVNVQAAQVGVTRLSIKEIEKLPSFLGEVDMIKGLLLQPGVSTIGEGSSGFNVRGGNVDQNLIMIDEGLIFNASHALGFFSSFNSDIVQSATLYKGTMPARFGGRLASTLDVNVRDGATDRWHLKGGLGLVSSRLTLDGPLGKKKKTTMLFSGRSTYSNWVLRQVNVPEVKSSSAYFYDLNARMVHRFDEKNNVSLSVYATEDQFSFNDEFGFDYGTQMGQLQYRRVLGAKMLATTNAIWSRYRSEQQDLDGVDGSDYMTGLSYVKFKQNVSYLDEGLELNAGASGIFYTIDGNAIEPRGDLSVIAPEQLDDEKGVEWGIYADMDLQLTPRFSIIAGLRYSIFQYLGPRNTFLYEDPNNPSVEGILEPVTLTDQVVKSFGHIQPRASFRYRVTPSSSIKAGYGRTVQYINQIFNSETPTPTNFWQLSNQYIPPQLAHNFSLGYFHNFADNLWVTSIEGFYRDIDQLFDFRGFADLLTNEHLETELLDGIGRSYGVEVSVNRQVGYVHGWLSYTYSRSERQIDGINEGAWYSSNFDKPHDFTLVTNFQINKRNSISINFTYGTGRPITVPVSKYRVQDRVVVLNYSDRNIFRVPDYHRLDLSYTLAQGFRKSKKFKTSWTFSIYNVYGRKNPYSVFVEQSTQSGTRINRLAVLGSAFPSLTFNFELL